MKQNRGFELTAKASVNFLLSQAARLKVYVIFFMSIDKL